MMHINIIVKPFKMLTGARFLQWPHLHKNFKYDQFLSIFTNYAEESATCLKRYKEYNKQEVQNMLTKVHKTQQAHLLFHRERPHRNSPLLVPTRLMV